ncbi:MAG: (Fe-S)-binding protein [Planctomycetota bacterium]|nr:(Fe-S)-binding protein [Planctomycetota bacterium]
MRAENLGFGFFEEAAGLRVLLFIPCLVDQFAPRSGEATALLLEHLGCEVVYPVDQTCCGQAHRNSGDSETARRLVLRMAKIFAGEDPIVTPSGSCAAMIRRHAEELFQGEDQVPDLVKSLVQRTQELIEFIENGLGLAPDEIVGTPGAAPDRVAWHPSCHLRELDRFEASGRFLDSVPGLKVARLRQEEQCCGFGGTFASKFGSISGALAEDRCSALVETEAPVLICNDTGCSMNIEGRLSRRGSPIPVMHISEWFCQALGLSYDEQEVDR